MMDSQRHCILVSIIQFTTIIHIFSTVNNVESTTNRFTYTSVDGNCTLPVEWTGSWSRGELHGNAPPVLINSSSMSIDDTTVLTCVKTLEDAFVFKEDDGADKPCYRCRLIFMKHHNVIQYRESDCNDKDEATFDDCASMSTSNPVLSLFRIGAKTEPCPFVSSGGRMTFDYTTDARNCPHKSSGSYLEPCSDAGTALFNYQACPNVGEQFKEELLCIGGWEEHSYQYFVGNVTRISGIHKEEGFKCFNYAEIRPAKSSADVIGYQMSRSGDTGSCAHAISPTDGSWTYKFTVQEEKHAEFPNWLDPNNLTEARWNALNLTFQFIVNVKGGKMITRPNPSQNSSTSGIQLSTYQFTASKIDYMNSTYASVEVVEFFGCSRLEICMDLYKRHDNVIELELYHRTVDSSHTTSCYHQTKVNPHLTYTIVKERPLRVQCPLFGVFDLELTNTLTTQEHLGTHAHYIEKCNTTLEKEDDVRPLNLVRFLKIGCSSSNSLDFYMTCHEGQIVPGEVLQLISGLDCIGTWQEDDKIFIVANNSAFRLPGHRCLELMQTPTPDSKSAYSIILRLDDCKPSAGQRLSNLTFNANKFAGCDEYEKHVKEDLRTSSAQAIGELVPNIVSCLILVVVRHYQNTRYLTLVNN